MKNERICSSTCSARFVSKWRFLLTAYPMLVVALAGCATAQQTDLQKAVADGDVAAVKALLTNGADPNSADEKGKTILMFAAESGNADLIKTLISAGAKVNQQTLRGATPLLWAMKKGDLKAIQLLLDADADINLFNEQNAVPLDQACVFGHLEVVKLLIARGADVNRFGIRDQQGNSTTPLRHAAVKGHQVIVEFLIQSGAKIDLKDERGDTVLMNASKLSNTNMVKTLVSKGADVNARAVSGHTALMYASYNGQDEVAKLLLDLGAEINLLASRNPSHQTEYGYNTALDYAMQKGHAAVIGVLKAAGAKTANAIVRERKETHRHSILTVHEIEIVPGNDKVSSFLLAVRKGDSETVKSILAQGVEVDLRQEDGWTPLMVAACEGQKGIAELLLDRGAKLDITNNVGCTVLMEVAKRPLPEMIRFLIGKGADAVTKGEWSHTSLFCAVYNNRLENVKVLLASGADIRASASAEGGITPDYTVLKVAKQEGRSEMIELLTQAGVEKQSIQEELMDEVRRGRYEHVQALIFKGAEIQGAKGCAALLEALMFNRVEIVKLLLDKGVDPNCGIESGITATRRAAAAGQTEVFKLLIARGNTVDDRAVLLRVAAQEGRTEIVKMLIDIGADVNKTGEKGETALSLSERRLHREVVEVLTKAGARHADGRKVLLPSPLLGAARDGNAERVLELIKQGEDVNVRGTDGSTPLLNALNSRTRPGGIDAARILIENGANVNGMDQEGVPLLVLSCNYLHPNEIDLLKLMIQQGADLEATSAYGSTPLMIFAQGEKVETVRLLIENGANVHAKGANGETALLLAAGSSSGGTLEIVSLLVKKGADVNARTKSNQTALSSAAARGKKDVAEFLRNAGAKE